MKPLFICAFFWLQTEVPFKPTDEFQVSIDLKLKDRDRSTKYGAFGYKVDGEAINKLKEKSLPFISIVISQIKIQTDEMRIIAIDSQGKTLLRKKATPVPELHLELGFVDDLKLKTVANEVTVYFLSAEKKRLRKIVMTVNQDGDFLVNGNWHGKF